MGKRDESSGLLFVAFMFLGMGVGYLLGDTAAGLFIGMGIGFMAMAYVRAKGQEYGEEAQIERDISTSSGRIWGTAIMILVGIGFILGGLSLLLGWRIPWNKLGGIFLILLGMAFLGMALERMKKESRGKASN